jgi:hypothetical protein
MSKTVNMRGRRGRIIAVLLAAVLGTTVAAWAYWSQPSKGSASGHVGSLNAPTISGATPGGGTVALTWTAVNAPAGGTVSYYVSRDGGAASSGCPSAAVPGTQTSCTDTSVSVATHSYTVTAVWRSWTAKSATASAQVTSGVANHFVLTPATSSPTAGAADNLTITAKDAANNTVTSYTGPKSLTFSGANTIGSLHPTVTNSSGVATEFGSSTTISFAAGVASVSGSNNGVMTLYKAETASVKVTEPSTPAIESNVASVTVSAGSAASFALSTATRTAGTAFGEELVAKDASGNTATSYAGAKTITFSGPGNSPNGKAPVLPTVSVTFTAGIGTTAASAITLYDADEGATLTATQGTITGTSASFIVNAGTATGFELASATRTAGESFAETITALDSSGNTATSYSGAKTLSFSGPSAAPEGETPKYTTALTFNAGSTTSSITLFKAETPLLKATQGALTGSASFVVSPASANKFSFSSISTQTAGSAFETTLTAKDKWGNTATSYSGSTPMTFEGPTASPQGDAPKYPATVTFNAGSGKASPITIYDAGSTALTATAGTISGKSASFTVNALSTTSRFSLSTPSPTAGQTFSETITAQDTYGNTTTGYSGKQTLTFSGPGKSPNNTSPSYPSQVTFSSGVGPASITLSAAQTTTLKVSQSPISGESQSFTVASAAPSSFTVTNPGSQTAGLAFNLAITAKDAFGNGVTGAQPIAFSLPSNAPDGTPPAYPASVTFTAGEGKASITLSDAQSTQIKLTQGTAAVTSSSFTVAPAPMSALALTAASASVIAGEGDELTIKAVDSFENTITSYTGPRSLTFNGAATTGSKPPTVSSSAGVVTNFGAPTSITFTSGVAKVSGSNNGLMRLYAIQTANVSVTDETFTSPSVAIAVKGTSISSLTLKNGSFNFGGSAKGKIESGDWFAIKFADPIAVNSMCSLWSGNGSDHSLSGNSEVTVTIVDGTGATNDTVTVTASKCTLHLGTIDLGSSAYVNTGNATFTGNGSNASTVEYKAGSESVEVELGGTKGGTGKIVQVGSSVATLTADPALTDEFGNTFPTFATTTATQF